MDLYTLCLVAAFAPLAGAAGAGFLGWKLGRTFAHSVTILSVAISLVVLVTGVVFFRSTEKTFADII